MHTILITGFEPFGGEAINPSIEVARRLHGWRPQRGVQVQAAELPCVFGDALHALSEAMQAHRPGIVIALGQASSRAEISIERVAINVDDARIRDNAGRQPVDEAIVPGAPSAYFSTLPIKAIVLSLREAGIPAAVSQTAGTFVCNHVFYGLAHLIATQHPSTRGGFIHLPCLPQQAANLPGTPSMALEVMDAALRIAVRSTLQNRHDLKFGAGAID